MKELIKSHGINFIKHGSCKRCGACEKPSCPHLTWEDGLATCKTYGKDDYLEWKCNVFPDSPFCDVVLDEICGYWFESTTKDDTKLFKKMLAEVKKKRLHRQTR